MGHVRASEEAAKETAAPGRPRQRATERPPGRKRPLRKSSWQATDWSRAVTL